VLCVGSLRPRVYVLWCAKTGTEIIYIYSYDINFDYIIRLALPLGNVLHCAYLNVRNVCTSFLNLQSFHGRRRENPDVPNAFQCPRYSESFLFRISLSTTADTSGRNKCTVCIMVSYSVRLCTTFRHNSIGPTAAFVEVLSFSSWDVKNTSHRTIINTDPSK